MDQVFEFVKSLELGKKLSPKENPDITWSYLFVVAFMSYFSLLSNHVGTHPVIGTIQRYNENKMNKIFASHAKVQMIYNNTNSNGYSDGVLWIDDEDSGTGGFLLFNELNENKINRWDEGKGLFSIGKTIYADKVGCFSNDTSCQSLTYPGPNGVLRVPNNLYPLNPKVPNAISLLVCQHGERSVSLLHDNGTQTIIASLFKGKRFNSPHDILMTPEGHLYFTDPPMGLYNKNNNKIQNRELPFYGIYFIQNIHLGESMRTGIPVASNDIKLVYKDMNRPTGLAFSPDFSKLYVTNSDPLDSYIKTFQIKDNGKNRY